MAPKKAPLIDLADRKPTAKARVEGLARPAHAAFLHHPSRGDVRSLVDPDAARGAELPETQCTSKLFAKLKAVPFFLKRRRRAEDDHLELQRNERW